MRKSWVSNLMVGLITTVVGVFWGWYLSDVYQRPKIEWYSRPYYKIDEIAIGNIFLWNGGHQTDHNISITLDANIKAENFKIVDLVSKYKIDHNDNKTTIIIDELKPGESADITFKDDPTKDDIEITSFVSEYSNIINIPFAAEPEWWQVSLWLEVLIAISILLLGFSAGYLVKNRYQE